MKLSEKLKNEFDYVIKSRGLDYFEDDLVSLDETDGNLFYFEVSGSSDYQVKIRVNKDLRKTGLDCTCPYFAKGDNCKHLWAAILEFDRLKLGEESLPSPDEKNISWKKKIEKIQKKFSHNKQLDEIDFMGYSTKPPSQKVGAYAIDLTVSEQKGRLHLCLLSRDRLKKGGLGKIKQADLDWSEIEYYEDAREKEFLWEILGKTENSSYYYDSRSINYATLLTGHAESLIKKISDCEKLYILHESKSDRQSFTENDLTPVQYDSTRWHFNLNLKKIENGYKLHGELLSEDGHSKPLDEIIAHINHFTLFKDNLTRSDLEDHLVWYELLEKQPLFIPDSDKQVFLDYFFKEHKGKTPIQLPAEFQLVERTDMAPENQLIVETDQKTGHFLVRLEFRYDKHIALANTGPYIYDFIQNEKIIRNLDHEISSLEKLTQLNPLPTENPQYHGYFGIDQFVTAVETALSYGWDVMVKNKKLQQGGSLKTEIASSGIDWFDVQLDFQFGSHFISLPQLLQALKSGQRLITLGDGSTGLLPEEWFKKVKPFLEIGKVTDAGIRISKIQALFLSAGAEQNAVLTGDKKFRSVTDLLGNLKNLKTKEASSHLKGELRPYQKMGLSWMSLMAENGLGGILADDMGLGKTIQVLSLLSQNKSKSSKDRILVVAPKSLLFNWKNEIEKFTPHIKPFIYIGDQRQEVWSLDSQHDLILTTYQTLRNDIEVFKDKTFSFLILDEAHYVKNPQSQIAMATKLISAHKKIALTGTPVENSLMDLFSILNIVCPGLISSSLAQKWVKEKEPENIKRLSRALSPFILRRTKQEVLSDLPEKTEQVLYVELTTEERKKYDELKKHYWNQLKGKIELKGLSNSKIEVLEALLRLRQASCHQGLLDKNHADKMSSKFELALEQLENVIRDGHKALVFSQFTSLLQMFAKHLTTQNISFEYLDGKTSNRSQKVENFQNNKNISVFLLSLKAGGVGLNLTAADYIYILDPWWNPAAESQAIDRAHRIGQTKKVFAYKIIAKDTVEEKILELQKHKKEIAKAVISEEASFLKEIKMRDVQELFS